MYDINTEAADQVASRFGAHVASTPEEIWAADDVDAVLIASSTNTHADLLSRAMQAHKPAHCEKPIDLNMERVKAVMQEAYHANVPIMIGFSQRPIPQAGSGTHYDVGSSGRPESDRRLQLPALRRHRPAVAHVQQAIIHSWGSERWETVESSS